MNITLPINIEYLIDLNDNASTYRFAVNRNERRRCPKLAELVEFITVHFKDCYKIEIMDWSETPSRKLGRLRQVTGKIRHGKRMTIRAVKTGEIVYTYTTTETYRTNWDIVSWIVRKHRGLNV